MQLNSYSVLMSLYKNESPLYLSLSLESILKQSVPPKEIILVVDGPISDDLKAILAQFQESLHLIQLNENHGLGYALAIGLKKCTSQLVIRMDTDDISLSDRAEIQLRYFQDHPETSVVGGNILEFENSVDDQEKNLKKVPQNDEAIRHFARKRNPMNHVTVMFRKQDVLAAGNYQTFLGFEDYYLWVRMMKKRYKFANVNQVLVYVRTNSKFVNRRRGFKYLKKELGFQKYLLNVHFITKQDYFKNVSIRCILRFLPSSILKLVYQKVARTKVTRGGN